MTPPEHDQTVSRTQRGDHALAHDLDPAEYQANAAGQGGHHPQSTPCAGATGPLHAVHAARLGKVGSMIAGSRSAASLRSTSPRREGSRRCP